MSNHSHFPVHYRRVNYVVIPVEALPIPFNITDVGRAFLAQLAAMESPEAQDSASQQSSGLH